MKSNKNILRCGNLNFILLNIQIHQLQRILPLSLTFDHRACTGGEAARFLAALLADLEKAR